MPRDYGPAGKWVHDRAHRIMREGETGEQYGGKKGKSVAYAIAVQQAHKLGKSPKGFRTPTGVRVAKKKFDMPRKEYRKTASLAGFFDEIDKIAQLAATVKPGATAVSAAASPARRLGRVLGRTARFATIPLALYGGYKLLKGRQQPQQPQMYQRMG
jgi:hypothetical protein